jgi:hypothetical protein
MRNHPKNKGDIYGISKTVVLSPTLTKISTGNFQWAKIAYFKSMTQERNFVAVFMFISSLTNISKKTAV